MDTRGRVLGWIGLIGGGLASISANVRSLWIPEHTGQGSWRTLPEVAPQDAGAFAMAILLPLAALVSVEMVNHWTHLPKVIRFGVLGVVALSALASSFVHVVTVFMWYGQPVVLAVLGTLAVDGIMILSGLALFTKDKDTPVDTIVDMAADIPVADSVDTDKAPDTVPDMDTLPPAPVPGHEVPRPRRPRPDAGWRADAMDMIQRGEPATDREIAEKILAGAPDTWNTVEAGRRAVARLRSSLA